MEQIEETIARYLQQSNHADPQESSMARTELTTHLKDRITSLKKEMLHLKNLEAEILTAPDKQISRSLAHRPFYGDEWQGQKHGHNASAQLAHQ